LWGPATEKLADPFVEVACSIDMVCSSIRVWYLSGPQVKLNELTKLPGVSKAFTAPFFHEAVLQLDRPVAGVLAGLSAQGILGGYDLGDDYPELGNAMLVCATEIRGAADITSYARAAADLFEVAA